MRQVNEPPKLLFSVRQQQCLLSILLIPAIATSSLLVLPMLTAVAQQKLPQLLVQTQSNTQESAVSAILRRLRRKEPPLGSRSNFFCAIAPGLLGEANVIWSDRPLFLWQGTASRFEVRLYSPFSPDKEQELLWSQSVTSQSPNAKFQRATYTGEALQPGQIYDWEIVIEPDSPRQRFTFQVMESEQRDRITAELTALEVQLEAAGATAEETALQRANYFAERDLWSDVLQEIYLVNNPSAAMRSNIQEIWSYLCEPNDSSNLRKKNRE